MQSSSSLLDTLRHRGLLYQQTEGLAPHLAGGARSVYCGFDPTAPSLHVGNLVPVFALLRLADAGHRAIALVGGGTALIGDPSGKSDERPLLSENDVASNAAAIAWQLRRIIGDRIDIFDNAEWLRPLGLVTFLRDIGKHFPINQMLAKDSVKARLDAGISFTEFAYMLLQAYDFAELHRRHGVTLQVGGSDQWGNIIAGCDLIRRTGGGEAHALTTPLLTTASGKKFGKTEGGAVWLDPGRTSPFAFYQYWINTDDADVGKLLRIFTLLTDDALADIERRHAAAPQERLSQRALASDMTSRVHSPADAERARVASSIVFDRKTDPRTIADDVFEMLVSDVPHVRRPADALGVAELLEGAFGVSRSQARMLVQQGSVAVNGAKLAGDARDLPLADAVRGRWFVVRKGPRDIAVIEVAR